MTPLAMIAEADVHGRLAIAPGVPQLAADFSFNARMRLPYSMP
jgi:hypothetical protein